MNHLFLYKLHTYIQNICGLIKIEKGNLELWKNIVNCKIELTNLSPSKCSNMHKYICMQADSNII